MPGPHDFAVRKRRRFVLRRIHVHRIPRSTFVTTRNAPPDERGTGEVLELICPTAKAKNFSWHDWTGQISLKALAKSVFWRKHERPGDIRSLPGGHHRV
jgi:hypothetical protein